MISTGDTVERGAAAFATTHWSAIRAAGQTGPCGRLALEQLCRTYWYPLYAYVRRHGHGREDAQDLTQSFFARFLEKNYLPRAHPECGKFRTFLLTSLQRFLVNEWKKWSAQKRGGHLFLVPLNETESEARYLADGTAETPQKLFEKGYAMALLDQVLRRLAAEFAADGKFAQFQQLKVLLWGDSRARSYSEIAADLGMSEGALKVAVHRLRRRFRELLRAEVERTVSTPEEVDEELRHLRAVFSG